MSTSGRPTGAGPVVRSVTVGSGHTTLGCDGGDVRLPVLPDPAGADAVERAIDHPTWVLISPGPEGWWAEVGGVMHRRPVVVPVRCATALALAERGVPAFVAVPEGGVGGPGGHDGAPGGAR